MRFDGFLRPEQAYTQSDPSFPWPYTEGLRLDEAMNELTLLTTGVFGEPLPKQHGAPVRIVTPWKYGYKGIKSFTTITLTGGTAGHVLAGADPWRIRFRSLL